MTLHLPDRWIWDFWFAQEGDDVHLFYLNAPRSLGDPDLRHHHARIGHAVSQDLRTWTVRPEALGPGPPGNWDDLATWTGSVIRSGDRWHLFYTGVNAAENGRVQRIGRAVSDDLDTWERAGLVLEADARWYEKLADGVGEEAWRDPWVFTDNLVGDVGFHMLITARARDGAAAGRGVIGHATSPDLESWTAGPPLYGPGEFSTLEVPQLLRLGGRWRILFSAHAHEHSAARLARPGVVPETGTHELVAERPLGPYRLLRDRFVVGAPDPGLYAGRLIYHRGSWHFMAWTNTDATGTFVGALEDPMPVTLHADGSLAVIGIPQAA